MKLLQLLCQAVAITSLISFPPVVTSQLSVLCPEFCICQGTQAINVVCCVGAFPKPFAVPDLPKNTTSADFSRCHLEAFPRAVVAKLRHLQYLNVGHLRSSSIARSDLVNLTTVRVLDITSGKILRVEPGAFSLLISLEELDISYNYHLLLSQLPNIFIGLNNTKIRRLFADGLNLYKYSSPDEMHLTKEHVKSLQYLKLDVLSIIDIGFQNFDSVATDYVSHVKCMSAANNFVSMFGYASRVVLYRRFATMATQVFSMSNQLHSEPISGYGKASDIRHRTQLLEACKEVLNRPLPTCSPLTDSEVRALIISHADLPQNRTLDSLVVPAKLQYVYADRLIRNSNLGTLIFHSNVITHIFLQHSTKFTLVGPIYGLNCLREANLAGSRLVIEDPTTFNFFPVLEKFNLSGCELGDQMRTYDNVLFQNMPNLLCLDLSYNNMKSVHLENLQTDVPKLEELHLQGNEFIEVPSIVPNVNLKYVNLQSCGLTLLSKRDRKRIEDVAKVSPDIQIDLRGNQFDCRCSEETFSFLKWLQETEVNLVKRDEVQCIISDETSRSFVSAVSLHYRVYWWHCYRDYVFDAICGLAGVAIVVICVVIMYMLRYQLRFHYYRLKTFARTVPTKVLRLPKEGPGVLVSSEERRRSRPKVYIIHDINDPVVNTFVQKRNTEFRSLNGVIGTQLFTFTNDALRPGESAVESINVAVEISACSLVILSPGLLKNPLAKWAVMSAVGRSPSHALVIEYLPIPTGDLYSKNAKILKYLRKSGSFVKWSEGESTVFKATKKRIENHLKDHSKVVEVDTIYIDPDDQHQNQSEAAASVAYSSTENVTIDITEIANPRELEEGTSGQRARAMSSVWEDEEEGVDDEKKERPWERKIARLRQDLFELSRQDDPMISDYVSSDSEESSAHDDERPLNP